MTDASYFFFYTPCIVFRIYSMDADFSFSSNFLDLDVRFPGAITSLTPPKFESLHSPT